MNRMKRTRIKKIDSYIARQFMSVFVLTLAAAVCIVSMAEIFSRIDLFISNDTGFSTIFKLFITYFPYAATLTIPAVTLFAASYVVSGMHAHNEVIAILNSGISFYRLTISIIAIGLLLSIASIFFDDSVTIKTNRARNNLLNELNADAVQYDNEDVAVWNEDFSILYYSELYDASEQKLHNVSVLFQNSAEPADGAAAGNGESLPYRIDAESARYDSAGNVWIFNHPVVYTLQNNSAEFRMQQKRSENFTHNALNLHPDYFRNTAASASDMPFREAAAYMNRMKFIDKETYYQVSTEIYERIFFSFTPLIAILLSLAIGTRLKKNVLVLSIFSSLAVLVVFYVVEFVFVTFAKQGYIAPIMGSLVPFTVFFLLGIVLFSRART